MRGAFAFPLLLLIACGGSGHPEPGTPQSTTPAVFTIAERAAAGATLDALSRTLRDSAAVCVELVLDGHSVGPDSAFLADRTPGRRFVSKVACPLTYLTMTGPLRDSLGQPVARPPGYVDPHHVRLYRPLFLNSIEAELRVRRVQGTWTYYYVCRIQADAMEGRAWQASCREIDRTVS